MYAVKHIVASGECEKYSAVRIYSYVYVYIYMALMIWYTSCMWCANMLKVQVIYLCIEVYHMSHSEY